MNFELKKKKKRNAEMQKKLIKREEFEIRERTLLSVLTQIYNNFTKVFEGKVGHILIVFDNWKRRYVPQ